MLIPPRTDFIKLSPSGAQRVLRFWQVRHTVAGARQSAVAKEVRPLRRSRLRAQGEVLHPRPTQPGSSWAGRSFLILSYDSPLRRRRTKRCDPRAAKVFHSHDADDDTVARKIAIVLGGAGLWCLPRHSACEASVALPQTTHASAHRTGVGGVDRERRKSDQYHCFLAEQQRLPSLRIGQGHWREERQRHDEVHEGRRRPGPAHRSDRQGLSQPVTPAFLPRSAT